MEEHAELRTMIAEGKDKLEWYRQVDPAKLNTLKDSLEPDPFVFIVLLKDLMNTPDYNENMTTLIRTIYEFAFDTYAGGRQ